MVDTEIHTPCQTDCVVTVIFIYTVVIAALPDSSLWMARCIMVAARRVSVTDVPVAIETYTIVIEFQFLSGAGAAGALMVALNMLFRAILTDLFHLRG